MYNVCTRTRRVSGVLNGGLGFLGLDLRRVKEYKVGIVIKSAVTIYDSVDLASMAIFVGVGE
jgi:hypothetical protein